MAELVEIEHRYLRSAIEFAVVVASEAQQRKLSISVPRELRSQIGKTRIAASALGRLRRAIEGDDSFRELIAVGAIPEVVDEVGALWLRQPDNWQADAAALIAAAEAQEQIAGAEASLKASERRRVAAERATVRAQAELVSLAAMAEERQTDHDESLAAAVDSENTIAELRAELIAVRNELRHARDRESAALEKLESAALDKLESAAPSSDGGDVLNDGDLLAVDTVAGLNRDTEIAAALDTARELAAYLESMLGEEQPVGSAGANRVELRVALSLPGGVISSSSEAAAFLVRTDAQVIIDGYNVAMLGWPSSNLESQRKQLLDGVENLARRFGTSVTVVFDGAAVVGAHTDRRRLIRVRYSPAGVTADDVIRSEVQRLPASTAVVVVTNDAEILHDVRAVGVNTLPSNALLAVL